jgi:hypothetical protein
MENIFAILSVSFALIAIIAVAARCIKRLLELRQRRRLEAEIVSLADDLSTSPDGLSLREIVDLLEVPMIEEVLLELRRMPPGSRKLQQAIQITGDAGYGQTA